MNECTYLAGSIIMLMKSTMLLLLLLAAVLGQSAASTLPAVEETTTAVVVDETATSTTTTNAKSKPDDYAKSVKIVFPSTDDSKEESKFDVYGLKNAPSPKGEANKTVSNGNITTETSTIETTASKSTAIAAGNSTDNVTPTSFDDRLGILNLAPHCPDGHVIVNQRCHKSA